MNELTKKIPRLLERHELEIAIEQTPKMLSSNPTKEERLTSLTTIFDAYLATDLTYEIYQTLYFSLIRSYQRKTHFFYGNNRISQGQNLLDVTVLTGKSGIGKTTTLLKCAEIIGNAPIMLNRPYAKIVNFIFVEASPTNSMKSFLLNILYEVDKKIGTNLYKENNNSSVYVEGLMNAVARTLEVSCGVLIIDEADRFAANKKSLAMVNFITQLINKAGVSVIFTGTPFTRNFFNKTQYLCRRSFGENYEPFNYNEEYLLFLKRLFEFQYTKVKTPLDSSLARLIFRLTNGVMGLIVALFYNAQKYAIERDKEAIDCDVVNYVFCKKMVNYTDYLQNEPLNHKHPKEDTSSTDFLNNNNLIIKNEIFKKAFECSEHNADKFLEILKHQIDVEIIQC